MPRMKGLHHITAMASDPARNLAFYRNVLGLRLVKKTVNFDDPGTYHLYYGDESGTPGSILTFFLWPAVKKGRNGAGCASEIAFIIPKSAMQFWLDRLTMFGIDHSRVIERFGEPLISFADPDGMIIELVGVDALAQGQSNGDVPADAAIRGFAGVTLSVSENGPTAAVLTHVFGYTAHSSEGAVERFTVPGDALATRIDLKTVAASPVAALGAGSIHHIAFRAADDADQAAMAATLETLRIGATDQKDRQYFRSIYFREPAGILFEIATDTPGFTVDEDPAHLGEALKLPEWFEPRRTQIEAALPKLD